MNYVIRGIVIHWFVSSAATLCDLQRVREYSVECDRNRAYSAGGSNGIC
jgi:hypothetical protein